MQLQSYIESCKQFSHDTKDWAELDNTKNYTTPGNKKGWAELEKGQRYIVTKEGKEIPIGLGKGIDVSWAFHKSDTEIEEAGPQQFVDLLIDEVFCVADIDYDSLVEAIDVFSH